MRPYFNLGACLALVAVVTMSSCSKSKSTAATQSSAAPVPVYFKVDPSTAGSVTGSVRYVGPRPRPKLVDMSNEPGCVSANHGKVHDDSIVVGPRNGLADAFVYIQKGLEGKLFAPAQSPVMIDQKGCWFRPYVLGVQTGQTLQIINSDLVTHNIHPMPQVNGEWSHSQGAGDPPMNHKFTRAEVMIPGKRN